MKQPDNFRLNLNQQIRVRIIHEYEQKWDRRILEAEWTFLAIEHFTNRYNKLPHIIIIGILFYNPSQTHNGLFPYIGWCFVWDGQLDNSVGKGVYQHVGNYWSDQGQGQRLGWLVTWTNVCLDWMHDWFPDVLVALCY